MAVLLANDVIKCNSVALNIHDGQMNMAAEQAQGVIVFFSYAKRDNWTIPVSFMRFEQSDEQTKQTG